MNKRKTVDETLEYHDKQLTKLYYMKENYDSLSDEDKLKYDRMIKRIKEINEERKHNEIS